MTGTRDPATGNPAIGKDVEANGIRTNYLEAGSGDRHVVLVHGSGPGVTAYANWRGVLPELGKDFHVVAPDMVGFGYSERPNDVTYRLDTWADQTIAVMDALGIEKAHLVGNSFGGAIALRLTTRHPDRVDRLVLMGSVGCGLPDHRGPRRRLGLRRHARGYEEDHGLLRLRQEPHQRRPGPGPLRGRHPARLPGGVLVDVPGPAAAVGGLHGGSGRGDPEAAAPHA